MTVAEASPVPAELEPPAGQEPFILHRPPDIVSTSGVEVVEFAAHCGIRLDPWQEFCVMNALSEAPAVMSRGSGVGSDDAELTWAPFEVGIVTPRQNGKNFVLEAIQLASLYLFGDETLVHSAHQFPTSVEHFNRLKFLLEETPELSKLLYSRDRSFVTSNGKEHIRLNTGQRVLFKARYRGASRGFVGDKVFMDEAFDIDPTAMGAAIPVLSTRPGAQVYYTSSAPHESSRVLHAVRSRARKGDPFDRLFYAEWGNEPSVLDLESGDPEFMAAIRRANPAVAAGRISEAYIAQEIRTFSGDPELVDEHRRERLGVASVPPASNTGPIPLEVWEALVDAKSRPAPDVPVSLAFDVSPERDWASFALAGRRVDGLGHVELRNSGDGGRLPGTEWVVARAAELARGHGTPIRIAKGSPGASFADAFTVAGVPVEMVSTGEYAAACGRLVDATRGEHPELRHLGEPTVARALVAAATKPTQDGAWSWSRRSSTGDITPLTSITLAWGAIDRPVEQPEEFAGVFGLEDWLDDD